jgi:hypothetical protein
MRRSRRQGDDYSGSQPSRYAAAELFELPLAFEIVEHNADGAAAVDVTPHGVAHTEDEPSLALRDEPVLGLLQFRLGNHERKACSNRCVLCNAVGTATKPKASSRAA